MSERLWYEQPAQHWEEALPVGNGRIGAMLYGGTALERMALNEETFWSGYPRNTNRANAGEHYQQARDLALDGKLHEAQALVESKMLGGFTQSYLPLCDLLVTLVGDTCACEDYRRVLDLQNALHTSTFSVGGTRIQRETFVSKPDDALFTRILADHPIELCLQLEAQLRGRCVPDESARTLTLDILAPSHVVPSYIECDEPITYDPLHPGMRARVIVLAQTNGVVTRDGNCLLIKGATELELRVVARTSFNGYKKQPFLEGRDEQALCARDVERLQSIRWEEALARHIADYRSLYDRVQLTLCDACDSLPTDVRLRSNPDAGLCALLFHYGRYLLIASSRAGGEPANLQGLWNHEPRAIWSCNYTLNINTEMNYWAAEKVGLSELCEPLFSFTEQLCERGRETARIHYGARGAAAHHNSDLWRLANPVGEQYAGFAGCAFWPMALCWLGQSLMEHWRYTNDDAFLEARALPVLREALLFCLDVATTDANGWLTIAPATSPENQFAYQGRPCKVARRAAMTTELLRETARGYLTALEALDRSEPMAAEACAALQKLAPLEVNTGGCVLEWETDYPQTEPRHRHVSHLYGLYPGDSVAYGSREAEACRQSLLARGDDGTGWSIAWKAALWARLMDGNHALRLLQRQLQVVEAGTACNLTHGGSYVSLLCAHPPFQIDGNLGACAAIVEMLLQYREGTLYVLPALPDEWQNGCVRGLCAPHGITVDIAFSRGKAQEVRIRRSLREALPVHVNGELRVIGADDAVETVWRLG